jgi:hypothetical protein
MSKYEAQRAMKEAKYARYLERSQSQAPSHRMGAAPAPAVSEAPAAPSAASPSAVTATCGHKSMNGRACTREAGHSEKSHRYS